MTINYHNRKFSSIANSSTGQVNGETVFVYTQHGNQLQATYQGGVIAFGQMLGVVKDDYTLDFLYHHIDINGNLKSGHCHSVPELLADGRIRLHETWQWDFGGHEAGASVIEEIL